MLYRRGRVTSFPTVRRGECCLCDNLIASPSDRSSLDVGAGPHPCSFWHRGLPSGNQWRFQAPENRDFAHGNLDVEAPMVMPALVARPGTVRAAWSKRDPIGRAREMEIRDGSTTRRRVRRSATASVRPLQPR